MTVAILHDVLEDGPGWTPGRLVEEGIPAPVVEAVTYLTKRPDEEADYERFIRRVAMNPLALRVKLADLAENMDLRRIQNPTDSDFERVKKYRAAEAILAAAEADLASAGAADAIRQQA